MLFSSCATKKSEAERRMSPSLPVGIRTSFDAVSPDLGRNIGRGSYRPCPISGPMMGGLIEFEELSSSGEEGAEESK